MNMRNKNSPIIYFGEDDKSYCSSCDYLLYERKDGSMVCSNGDCGRIYSPNEVRKHKSKLGPEIEKRAIDGDGPEVVPITDYTNMKRKIPTPGDIEDKAFV